MRFSAILFIALIDSFLFDMHCFHYFFFPPLPRDREALLPLPPLGFAAALMLAMSSSSSSSSSSPFMSSSPSSFPKPPVSSTGAAFFFFFLLKPGTSTSNVWLLWARLLYLWSRRARRQRPQQQHSRTETKQNMPRPRANHTGRKCRHSSTYSRVNAVFIFLSTLLHASPMGSPFRLSSGMPSCRSVRDTPMASIMSMTSDAEPCRGKREAQRDGKAMEGAESRAAPYR